jgi:hypothetical protein
MLITDHLGLFSTELLNLFTLQYFETTFRIFFILPDFCLSQFAILSPNLSSIVYYLSSIVYCLFSIVYYLSSIVYCLLSIIYYLLSIVYYLTSLPCAPLPPQKKFSFD